jgi:hypothetical protein
MRVYAPEVPAVPVQTAALAAGIATNAEARKKAPISRVLVKRRTLAV